MALPPADGSASIDPASIVCDAIRQLRTLVFVYEDKPRLVEPYVHGTSRKGAEMLRAIQVGGSGSGYGFGKLWELDKMVGLRMTDRAFVPDDPNYNPDDSALVRIHCRVEPAARLRLAPAGGRARR